MTESESIRQIAKQTLTLTDNSGKGNHWLWDRTLRIVRNVEHICRLPELAMQAISIERSCLMAAAYFSLSGLVRPATAGNGRRLNRADISEADLCSLSANIAAEKLSGILHETRITKICRIITESCDRFTELTEAAILSDGRNLEDIGAVGLLHELRQHIINGKSISEVLDNWKCKIEYGYWQARLKEGFRYDAVRQMAGQRFEAMEQFMEQLAAENTLGGLQERLLETVQSK